MGTIHAPPAYLLSHHSSNPLQVPSDDSLNAAYVSQLRPLLDAEKARAAQGLPPKTSSTPSAHVSLYDEGDDANMDGDLTFRPTADTLDGTLGDPYITTNDNDVELSHHAFSGLGDVEDNDDGVNIHFEDFADGMDPFDDSQLDATMLADPERLAEYHEENSIMLRPPEERAQVQAEMRDLESAVPRILRDYRLLDRLGEGESISFLCWFDLSPAHRTR